MERTYHRTKREIEYLLSHQELLSASETQELVDSLRAVDLQLALMNRKAEKAKLLSSYDYFFRQAWAWVENVQLVANWHIGMMCRYLQALQARDPFRDLIINVPPGCSKSLNTMVIWPAWVFAKDPTERMMCVSYDGDLVKKQAVDSKRLMQSDWYQSFFGDDVQIRPDVDTQVYFETTSGGSRFSTTPKGRATGRHPTLLACDDVSNPKQAGSQTEREALIEWWDGTMETRGAAAEMNRARVIIAQRLHVKDIPGHVMSYDDDNAWARLILPMRYEPDRMPDIGLGTDPRTTPGELLDPIRFPEAAVKKTERRLGIYGTAGQLQQRPTLREGALFKIDQIQIVSPDAVPWKKMVRFKRAWDKAGTKGAGDFTAGAEGGIIPGKDPKIFITDMAVGQWSTGEVEKQIDLWARLGAKKYGFSKFETVFEEEGGSSGKQAAADTKRRLRGCRVRSIRPTGSKLVRAEPFANAIEAGEVYFVEGRWIHDCIDQMRNFPKSDHDDMVDALSLLYMTLVNGSMFEGQADEEATEPQRCKNPRCNRLAGDDTDYCCHSCVIADSQNRRLDDSAHCPECAYRHSQMYGTGEWSPDDFESDSAE